MAGTAAGVLLLVVLLQILENRSGAARYQQHLEQPSEEALGACGVCGGQGELCTHLPIICIETGGQKIPGRPIRDPEGIIAGAAGYELGDHGEESIVADFSIVQHAYGWNHPDDAPSDSGEALIRLRGNSSRWFSKGSYSFKTIAHGDPEDRLPAALLGMNPGSEWVLHGPCLDRTLVRNYLCYTVAGQIMDYAPNCRFCELLIDGEYRGVYLLTEAITRGDGRVPLTESSSGSPVTSWLIRLDRDHKSTAPLNSFSYYTFRLETSQADLLYPGKNAITPEKLQYVTSELSSIERTIYSDSSVGSADVYTDLLDLTAFAQYYIINEFFGNMDAGQYSTYYYKDIRGKVTPVVWDFNNACDNYISDPHDASGFHINLAPPFNRLVTEEGFVNEVIRQYRRLRKTYLSDDRLEDLIDGAVSYLGSAADRNNEAWSGLFDLNQYDDFNYLSPVSRNYQSYPDAVAQLKTWLAQRGRWMDGNIEHLRQHCHPSRYANQARE